jgi:hypothetical protein
MSHVLRAAPQAYGLADAGGTQPHQMATIVCRRRRVQCGVIFSLSDLVGPLAHRVARLVGLEGAGHFEKARSAVSEHCATRNMLPRLTCAWVPCTRASCRFDSACAASRGLNVRSHVA